jgi:DNA-binding GntR family transcriptional regulator
VLRLKMEPELAGLGALKATPEEQDEARGALAALDAEIAAHGPRIGTLNRAFHLALARPAQRPVTLQVLERLHILSERYVRKHLEPKGREDRARDEHRVMLDLWIARAEADVVRSAAEHLEKTLADLRAQLGPAA